jgi:hypothetical protein
VAEEAVVTDEPVPSTNGASGDASETTKAAEAESRRERSTIEFPYTDLNDAVTVAKAIHQNWGQYCSPDQLAAVTGHGTIAGGAFRLKVSGARIFGLIETSRDQIALTELGREVVNPEREPQARAKAFLKVPLYKALFDSYRGYPLPRNIAIENEMVRLGVSPKQKDKARQVFQRSADQAGFFAHGRDRLVMPANVAVGDAPTGVGARAEDTSKNQRQGFGGTGGGGASSGVRGGEQGGSGIVGSGGTGGGTGLHPFIQGLLLTLPEPGTPWSEDKQQQWLSTAKQIFGLLYPRSDDYGE